MKTFPDHRAALIAAIVYGLVLLQAPWHAMDLIRPSREAPAAGEFPCAGHGCGCESLLECRERCCCFRELAASPRAESCHESGDGDETGPRVEARLVAGCSGGPDESSGPGSLAPHLVPRPALTIATPIRGESLRSPPGALRPAPGDPPLKVPIASSSITAVA